MERLGQGCGLGKGRGLGRGRRLWLEQRPETKPSWAGHRDTPGSTPKHRGRPCGCWHTGLQGSCVPCCLEAGWGRAHRRKGSSTLALRQGRPAAGSLGSSGDEALVAPRVAVIMLHIQLHGASRLSSLPHWSLLPNKLPELSPLLRSTAGGFGTKTSISLCPWYEVPPLPTCPPRFLWPQPSPAHNTQRWLHPDVP